MALKRLTPWVYEEWERKNSVLSVYVMTVDGTCCKIGFAADVWARNLMMQIGCPDRIDIFWCARFLAKEAKKTENKVHKDLKEQGRYMRGEWFRIHPLLAVDTVKRIAREFGYDFTEQKKAFRAKK